MEQGSSQQKTLNILSKTWLLLNLEAQTIEQDKPLFILGNISVYPGWDVLALCLLNCNLK